MKQGGYWSDENLSLQSRLALSNPLTHLHFLIETQESHVLHAHCIVSIVHTIPTMVVQEMVDRPIALYPKPNILFISLDLCPHLIRALVFRRIWVHSCEGKDGDGLTLSWLIGPIVTSHFLGWSDRQLPSRTSPSCRCDVFRQDPTIRSIYQSRQINTRPFSEPNGRRLEATHLSCQVTISFNVVGAGNSTHPRN